MRVETIRQLAGKKLEIPFGVARQVGIGHLRKEGIAKRFIQQNCIGPRVNGPSGESQCVLLPDGAILAHEAGITYVP
jgi:hypothetical protein